MTEWGAQVEATAPWTEHPRPQVEREAWTSLNGLWGYAIGARGGAKPTQWEGEILVPFCPESPLSGVGRLLEPGEALWYRRTFEVERGDGLRALLHFEAVDYEAKVWVNGQEVGSHRGGHTPFHFDVSSVLREGANELVVRVHDGTEGFQLRGKQALKPGEITYTRVSGIWQSVWLEQVPERRIADLSYAVDLDAFADEEDGASAAGLEVNPLFPGHGPGQNPLVKPTL